jgi:CHASE3 domain sensor protein
MKPVEDKSKLPSYFLMHVETGQRYPIRGPVIIGRSSGDICFPRDTKLSAQHCEVRPSELGLAVRDLHSGNGTFIDGKQMPPDRNFLLQVKGELRVGDQQFTMQSVSLTKNIRRRRRKKRSKTGESYTQVFFVAMVAIAIFVWNNRIADRSYQQVQLSQKQLGEIFAGYQDLQASLERETAPPQEIARRIQGQTLGRLATLTRRWAEFQPTESERAMFNSQLHFAAALAGHAKAEILLVKTGDSKYLEDVDQFTDQIEQAVNEIHALPAGTTFPSLVQSPLQLVEREMRQSLREYKKLGTAVQNKEITGKQMGQRIRENLIPKMEAVYAKMGAITPQNNFENRKVVLEQRLMTAVIGQVKNMSLVASGADQKYAVEMQHWTAEIEKVSRELKAQLGYGRRPAGQEGPKNP